MPVSGAWSTTSCSRSRPGLRAPPNATSEGRTDMALTRSTARRYAEAAMDIAVRDGTVEEWLASLDAATAALSDPTVTRVLANPALPYAGRSQAAAQLLGTAIDDKPRNLVLLLIRRGRIEQLPDVAREFRRLRDLREGIVHATVT